MNAKTSLILIGLIFQCAAVYSEEDSLDRAEKHISARNFSKALEELSQVIQDKQPHLAPPEFQATDFGQPLDDTERVVKDYLKTQEIEGYFIAYFRRAVEAIHQFFADKDILDIERMVKEEKPDPEKSEFLSRLVELLMTLYKTLTGKPQP